MSIYQAPIEDYQFLYRDVFKLNEFWQHSTNFTDATDDMVDSILDEADKICRQVLLPINASGDAEGCHFDLTQTPPVHTPKGFVEAYQSFSENGWFGLCGSQEYGAMGFPKSVGVMFEEMLYATNCSFTLYLGLTTGVSQALLNHASDELKQKYLPKLYSGEYSGSMCLTEPHAGTNLGSIRTKAVPISATDQFEITGNKIFITAGEHDLSKNIIHLVLARIEGEPEGNKGISLFLVSKFNEDEQGNLTNNNHVQCTNIEHKMGIKASATCALSFEKSKGVLIGKKNQGLQAMFTMMNFERLSIAVQGLGLGDIAWQNALEYAKEREQGQTKYGNNLLAFGDVRRMLKVQEVLSQGARCLAIFISHKLDQYKDTQDEKINSQVALLTPVVKAFLTDRGFESTVLAQQIYGGHGFIQETGAEQYVRDARIAQIYEGTNGVQALDFLGRKVAFDQAVVLKKFTNELFAEMQTWQLEDQFVNYSEQLELGFTEFLSCTNKLLAQKDKLDFTINAVCTDYLDGFGYLMYGYFYLKMINQIDSGSQRTEFIENKKQNTHFYFQKLFTRMKMHVQNVNNGAQSLLH
ncbi:acyl-CoA dehydrogenase family protein [Marinicellulosiphila megalodicopiae]|uniref:acyl-CoA dehydrogenase family protein n=1 Tax=Marinicellulosiphila megalodicopiae TaxID=2724896 RepID=UPI003BB025AD